VAVARLPFVFLGDLGEDPIVLAAAEKRVAVLTVGGLVHVDLCAAVGAVAFDEAGLFGVGRCAAAAEEGPDFGERLVEGREDFPVAQADLSVDGRGGDADRELVEMFVALEVGQGDGFDGDVFHRVSVAQGLLLVELEAEALVDGVGDEGPDGGKVLVAPCELDLLEGRGDAQAEGAFVEGGVGGVEGAEDVLAVELVVVGVGLADDVGLPGAFAFAAGVPEEGDDQDEEWDADVGVVVAEAQQVEEEVEEVAGVAAASTAGGSAAGVSLAAAGAGEEEGWGG
jgi:hypothetical protein